MQLFGQLELDSLRWTGRPWPPCCPRSIVYSTSELCTQLCRWLACVQWVGANLRFDLDKTVSLFETNIRVMGGLLSAHLLASDESTVQTLYRNPYHITTTPYCTTRPRRGKYAIRANMKAVGIGET